MTNPPTFNFPHTFQIELSSDTSLQISITAQHDHPNNIAHITAIISDTDVPEMSCFHTITHILVNDDIDIEVKRVLSGKDPNLSRRHEACGDFAAAWAEKRPNTKNQTSKADLDTCTKTLWGNFAESGANCNVPVIYHSIHGDHAPTVFDFRTIAASLRQTYTAIQSQMTEMQQNPSHTAYSQLMDISNKLEICEDLAKVWIEKCPKDETSEAQLECQGRQSTSRSCPGGQRV